MKHQQKDTNFFRGFVLYNPKTGKQLVNHNGSKYFTPASNTKLYTFYAAYKTLGDSLKGLEYAKINDTLVIKGTADPSFLYGFDSKTLDFLKTHSGPIAIVNDSIDDNYYGNGWSWDDYHYYYMPEKSRFPIYGNVVSYAIKHDETSANPSHFISQITVSDSVSVNRISNKNAFFLKSNDTTFNDIPFKTSNKLVAKLLSDTLRSSVNLISEPKQISYKPFYSVSSDSVYKQLLVVSDNFIAEQLMLQVGNETTGSYNVNDAIDYSLKHYLPNLPQKPRWVDGSGLSRYNLFTPEDNVHLLTKMYQEIPLEKLLSYFPAGGKSGTLKRWYGHETAYVYAKSGTLSNNYNLSGYLITKKGTLLIFSYMNNHYKLTNSQIKAQIQEHLEEIYNRL